MKAARGTARKRRVDIMSRVNIIIDDRVKRINRAAIIILPGGIDEQYFLVEIETDIFRICLLYTSPSPRDS